MFELPVSVTVADKEYPIRNKGDYRMVLDCFNALNDEQLSQEDRVLVALIIFYDNVEDELDLFELFGENIQYAVNEMFMFFNTGRITPLGTVSKQKLMDWKTDEQLIAGAVNLVAGREIRLDNYLHWWTFMGYFQSIGESTLATVVRIRGKLKSGKKLEKYEQEFRRDNPSYFIWDDTTPEDRELMDVVTSIWNSGGQ